MIGPKSMKLKSGVTSTMRAIVIIIILIQDVIYTLNVKEKIGPNCITFDYLYYI